MARQKSLTNCYHQINGVEYVGILSKFLGGDLQLPQLSRQDTKWSPPPDSMYKVNVDAAFNPLSGLGGIGIVVRDNCGQFMAGKTQVLFQGDDDPHQAELYAARAGLSFAWELGSRRITLEGDAKNVISSTKGSTEDLSYNGFIFRDIFMFASWFDCFDYNYVPRICNEVADFLARKAFSEGLEIWIEDPPEDILPLLVNDIISIQ